MVDIGNGTDIDIRLTPSRKWCGLTKWIKNSRINKRWYTLLWSTTGVWNKRGYNIVGAVFPTLVWKFSVVRWWWLGRGSKFFYFLLDSVYLSIHLGLVVSKYVGYRGNKYMPIMVFLLVLLRNMRGDFSCQFIGLLENYSLFIGWSTWIVVNIIGWKWVWG